MRRWAIILLAVLASCGDGGDREGGEGYSFELPDGWSDREEESQDIPIRFDSVFGKEPRAGFATNVNVIRIRADEDTSFRAIKEAQRDELESFGAREVSGAKPLELDGEDASQRTYSARFRNIRVRGRQVVSRHEDRIYSVTFTAKSDYFDRDEPEFDEILESWEWD